MHKKRFLLLLLVVAFLVAGCSEAKTSKEKLTLSVAGYGQATSVPDVAYVQLGVSTINPNLSVAVREANRVNQAITEAVATLDVPSEDVQTGSYNVWREDIYDPEVGLPTGEFRFHVDITLSVRVVEVGSMGEIISAALNAGANTVYGINFGVQDTSLLAQAARADALIDLQARAQQIAEGLKMELGAPLSVSEGSAPVPEAVYSYGIKGDIPGYGGGGDSASVSPVSAGQTSVSVQLYAIYELIPR